MKNTIVLGVLTLIAWTLFSVHQFMFPPPPAEYRVVYLGSDKCGVCRYWLSNHLKAWRHDSASVYLDLELATLKGNPFRGGYGKHDPVFQEAIGSKGRISYPSFVLYNRGEMDGVYIGIGGWMQIEKRVRAEARRAKRRGQQPALQ
jgi:hypothetical protein